MRCIFTAVITLPFVWCLSAYEPTVSIIDVVSSTKREEAKVVGTVASARSTTLAARVSASVVDLPVALGDAVAAGQVLVQLEAEEIRARLANAQAQLALAEADLARAERLVASGTATAANVDSVRAAARSARAQLAEAETMVGYLTIRAPYAGVITARHAEAGDLAQPGRALLEIADPAALRFEARVPESLIDYLRLGQGVDVVIQGRHHRGPIVQIAAAAEVASRSVLVKVDLPQSLAETSDETVSESAEAPLSALRLGQFGRLLVVIYNVPVLAVPDVAVMQRGQLQQVAVLENGQVHLRLVRSGRRWLQGQRVSEDSSRLRVVPMVDIVAGLKPGDQVLLHAQHLRDGQPWPETAP
ncbi:MAG: efflux RND transporter periplasmic adaptor subunit [Planctomycetota bacterium]|nr:MAG: efflux RND transporter periplasmic adaptor subunit [Planctomycetota bacterium]